MGLSNEHLTRQMEILPPEKLGQKITIIGAGAIGSWTALALAKMGFTDLTVYDPDNIDVVNMNSQFYPLPWVGTQKAAGIQKLVREFTGVQLRAIVERYESGIFPGIVIAAVDSMDVRRNIWMQHVNQSPFTKAVIDPRMGAESALLYVMNPMDKGDQQSYEKSLYSDDQAVQERCTAKATIYTANLLSGLVCKAVKDLAVGEPDYLRTAQWDIKRNQLMCFTKKGANHG